MTKKNRKKQEIPQTAQMTPDENFIKARKARNLAIALSLVAFVVVLFLATWLKLGANILDRPL